MKKPDEIQALPASELITQRIADLGDRRGKALALNSAGKKKPARRAKA